MLITGLVAVTIRCSYLDKRWFQRDKKLFSCETRYVKSTTPWGTFMKVKSNFSGGNSKIEIISFVLQTLNYFPAGLDVNFPNLKEIFIQECNVFRLEQPNFRPFTKLEVLSIRANLYLEVLERGLFDYNKKLKFVNLYYNSFKHIDADLVSGLNFIQYFELERVTCFNMTINGNGTAISMAPFKPKFTRHCQDLGALKQHLDFSMRKNLHCKIEDELQSLIRELQSGIKELKQVNESTQSAIKSYGQLMLNITKLSKEISKIGK